MKGNTSPSVLGDLFTGTHKKILVSIFEFLDLINKFKLIYNNSKSLNYLCICICTYGTISDNIGYQSTNEL